MSGLSLFDIQSLPDDEYDILLRACYARRLKQSATNAIGELNGLQSKEKPEQRLIKFIKSQEKAYQSLFYENRAEKDEERIKESLKQMEFMVNG